MPPKSAVPTPKKRPARVPTEKPAMNVMFTNDAVSSTSLVPTKYCVSAIKHQVTAQYKVPTTAT